MKRSISDFINKEYKDYASYVIYSRAIPNLIDGLKPVQRKALFTGLKHCKNSFTKTAALGGYTIAEANYVHGDSSITGAINLMTQDFIGSNNIPFFSGKGNFGNRLIQTPAAPRYTSIKVNSEIFDYFKDFDILDKNSDPDNPEPLSYLPTIPWSLVNGIEGIAVGFSTKILPRNPKNLKKIVKAKLEDKTVNKNWFNPYWEGFQGKIEYDNESRAWEMYGIFEKVNQKKIKITELPIGWNREKYIIHLDKLIEKKKIRSYEDFSKKNFEFIIKLYNELEDEKIIQLLKLKSTFNENIVVIDNEGNLRKFDNPEELVDEFLEYRLKKYKERLNKYKKKAEEEIRIINEKIKFIQMIENKDIILTKITKEELAKKLKKEGFKFLKDIVNERIYKFSKNELEKFSKRKLYLEKTYLPELQKTSAKDEWKKEL